MKGKDTLVDGGTVILSLPESVIFLKIIYFLDDSMYYSEYHRIVEWLALEETL